MIFLEKVFKVRERFELFVFCMFFVTACASKDDTFHIKQFIVLEDVLLPSEKSAFKMETDVNARFYVLDTDSKLTDLGRSFPIELAATGSCLVEMEVLNRCLTNRNGRSNEKLSITTLNVSRARKLNIKQIEVIQNGQKVLIDEDCTNNQIDLEECIINKNRYYPCTPPDKDLKKYRNLFLERSEEFSKVLKENGYRLVPVMLQFEFGGLKSYEVVNFNEKYHELSANFLKAFSEEKLPEAFESFKTNFMALKNVIPTNSLRFSKFEKDLRIATCRREIADNSEILENINQKITKMKKKVSEAENELDNVQKSIPAFLEQIPKQVPYTCDEKYQLQVENKIKVMEVLGWNCKED